MRMNARLQWTTAALAPIARLALGYSHLIAIVCFLVEGSHTPAKGRRCD
jgi:hypothetical protein